MAPEVLARATVDCSDLDGTRLRGEVNRREREGLRSIRRGAGVPMNTQSSPCQHRAGGGVSSWTNALQRNDGCGKKDEQHYHCEHEDYGY